MVAPSFDVDVYVRIAAAREQVWRAIVDGEARAAWWGYLELDAIAGGQFEERWNDADGRSVRTHWRVIEIVSGTLLRLGWRDDGWPESTEVELRLAELEGATSVRVVHVGWERLADGAALAAQHRTGWTAHLENLRGYVENQRRRS